MKQFLFSNIHWLLLIFMVVNLIMGFINFTYSKQDFIAMIFGVVGLLAVTYLVIRIESRKRRDKEDE